MFEGDQRDACRSPLPSESKSIRYAAVREPSPRTCERLDYVHRGPIPAQNDAGWNVGRKWGREGALGSEETTRLRQELEWRLEWEDLSAQGKSGEGDVDEVRCVAFWSLLFRSLRAWWCHLMLPCFLFFFLSQYCLNFQRMIFYVFFMNSWACIHIAEHVPCPPS
jgi:hypothetical protein